MHCVRLREVRLPGEGLVNCAALTELAIPPSLHYIASRAFLDCTLLHRLTKLPGRRTTWRGA